MSSTTKKVLFVCLGNICRSPMAEAVFSDILIKKDLSDKWEVDSAGIISWHVGKSADSRTLNVLSNHGISYNRKARQLTENDFQKFDFVFGMDDENVDHLTSEALTCNSTAQIFLLGDFDPQKDRIIRDPYYDHDLKGFQKCYEQCVRCCESFLEKYS